MSSEQGGLRAKAGPRSQGKAKTRGVDMCGHKAKVVTRSVRGCETIMAEGARPERRATARRLDFLSSGRTETRNTQTKRKGESMGFDHLPLMRPGEGDYICECSRNKYFTCKVIRRGEKKRRRT